MIWNGREHALSWQQPPSAAGGPEGTYFMRIGERLGWTSTPTLVDDRATLGAGTDLAFGRNSYGTVYTDEMPRGGTVFFRLVGCP